MIVICKILRMRNNIIKRWLIKVSNANRHQLMSEHLLHFVCLFILNATSFQYQSRRATGKNDMKCKVINKLCRTTKHHQVIVPKKERTNYFKIMISFWIHLWSSFFSSFFSVHSRFYFEAELRRKCFCVGQLVTKLLRVFLLLSPRLDYKINN